MFSLLLENPLLFEESLGVCLKLRNSQITRENYFALSNFRWNLISDRMHLLVKEFSGVIFELSSVTSSARRFIRMAQRARTAWRNCRHSTLTGNTAASTYACFHYRQSIGKSSTEKTDLLGIVPSGNTTGALDHGQYAGRF